MKKYVGIVFSYIPDARSFKFSFLLAEFLPSHLAYIILNDPAPIHQRDVQPTKRLLTASMLSQAP